MLLGLTGVMAVSGRQPAFDEGQSPKGVGPVFRVLKRSLVALGMASVGLFFMGQFALFTYVRPFLETVTQVDVSTLSLILLGIGVAGLVGTSLIGGVLETGLYRTLITLPWAMAAIALALIAFGSSLAFTATVLALWVLIGTAAPVGWRTWLARLLPDDAEAGGGVMVAVIQLAITLVALVSGVLLDTSAYPITFAAGTALLVIAAVLTVVTSKRGLAAP